MLRYSKPRGNHEFVTVFPAYSPYILLSCFKKAFVHILQRKGLLCTPVELPEAWTIRFQSKFRGITN
ncbi:hypothetical protein Gasu2_61370 [Galdieria sulphuraria]|nr:hypothetical protein Gasu2_61370 [Galdieria sulphuraria]